MSSLCEKDFHKVIERLKENPGILDRCMEVLAVDVPKAVLWQGIRGLGKGMN